MRLLEVFGVKKPKVNYSKLTLDELIEKILTLKEDYKVNIAKDKDFKNTPEYLKLNTEAKTLKGLIEKELQNKADSIDIRELVFIYSEQFDTTYLNGVLKFIKIFKTKNYITKVIVTPLVEEDKASFELEVVCSIPVLKEERSTRTIIDEKKFSSSLRIEKDSFNTFRILMGNNKAITRRAANGIGFIDCEIYYNNKLIANHVCQKVL